jgi:hypothetical protein
MSSFSRVLSLFVALPLITLALGCAPHDKHVFLSTVNQPTSVALLDTYQSEAVWEMDIPVNHKLELVFAGNKMTRSNADGVSPSWVKFKLYRADDLPTDTGRDRKGTLILSDRIDLTGKQIRMQVSYRPAPELPGSIDAAPVPVRDTAQSVADEAIAESKAQTQATDEMTEADQAQETATEAAEEATEEAAEDAAEEATEEMAEDAAEEAAEEGHHAVEEAAEAAQEVPVQADTTDAADAAEVAVEEAAEEAAEDAAATQPTK